MTSRGLRNNNPGNIRKGSQWRGLAHWSEMTAAQKNEKEFCVFICPVYGIRALCRVMLTYRKKGYRTAYEIINRYAPSSENNTKSYSSHISHRMGLQSEHEEIDVTDPEIMRVLIESIVYHENGDNPYTHEIEDGMLLAGIK